MKPLSTETTISKNRFALVAFVGAFVFFAFITWCTPYSSDDLEFAYLISPQSEDISISLYTMEMVVY